MLRRDVREVGCIREGDDHLQKCAKLRSPFFHHSRRETIADVHFRWQLWQKLDSLNKIFGAFVFVKSLVGQRSK